MNVILMKKMELLPGADLFQLNKPPEWFTVARPGSGDRNIEEFLERSNQLYGAGNWRVIFMEKNIELVKSLTESASDIYDTTESDVKSGTDYHKQESQVYHFQDIAIRRVLQKMNVSFKGSGIAKLAGKDSPAGQLSAKKIPFHKPEQIIRPKIKGRWSKNSIEDFWQCNKLLQVKGEIYLESSPPELALVLRRDLKLGKGKFAAQASHGAITRIYQSSFNDTWSSKWEKSKGISIWTIFDLREMIDLENSCREWGMQFVI
ncbi:MAG: peptidyl-tRNA hydrolase, partial [Candidatus Hodarchaeales archaeon]